MKMTKNGFTNLSRGTTKQWQSQSLYLRQMIRTSVPSVIQGVLKGPLYHARLYLGVATERSALSDVQDIEGPNHSFCRSDWRCLHVAIISLHATMRGGLISYLLSSYPPIHLID